MMTNRLRRLGTVAYKFVFGWALILSYAGYVAVAWVRHRLTDTSNRGNG